MSVHIATQSPTSGLPPMIPLPFPTAPHIVSPLNGPWDYWRPAGSRIVELGTVRGLDVALPVHFHDEDQMTFVLSGRRRFVIGGERADAGPGQGVIIPARTPHRSLTDTAEVVCINMYLPPGAYGGPEVIAALARHWRRTGGVGWADLMLIAEDHRCTTTIIAEPAQDSPDGEPWETVDRMARRAGLTREGFTRRFTRLHGVPPHTFSLLEKLNAARRRLRAGEAIAGVAADTGFTDQSHLGRCFRRAFGVTPGQYRTR